MTIHTLPPDTTEFFRGGPPLDGYRPDHPQVALYNAPLIYGGFGEDVSAVVYVDIQMADPLLRMWQAGIRTTWSCQGDALQRGYCVIADAARTYEAVQIIGAALDVCQFSFDSLRMEDDPLFPEVLRWSRR